MQKMEQARPHISTQLIFQNFKYKYEKVERMIKKRIWSGTIIAHKLYDKKSPENLMRGALYKNTLICLLIN
jgi:hypothetical protein